MTTKQYNGWSNYETWAVALWLDNEQASYAHWRMEARRHQQEAPTTERVQRGTWTADEAARFHLADGLKEAMETGCPMLAPSMYTDLLHAALSEVDWQEIADHLLEDVQDASKERKQTSLPDGLELVDQYTRADALTDGTLMDISEIAQEAGIQYSTAITAAAWQACVQAPEGVAGSDEQGRLWDVLSVLRHAMQSSDGGDRVDFQMSVQTAAAVHATRELYALCHPGDDGQTPVITVMLRGED